MIFIRFFFFFLFWFGCCWLLLFVFVSCVLFVWVGWFSFDFCWFGGGGCFFVIFWGGLIVLVCFLRCLSVVPRRGRGLLTQKVLLPSFLFFHFSFLFLLFFSSSLPYPFSSHNWIGGLSGLVLFVMVDDRFL